MLSEISDDKRSLQGVLLLLVSLGVFFFASLILYAIYVVTRITPDAGPIIPFYVPPSFLLTTILLVTISILLHLSVLAARHQRLVDLHRYIVLALLLSLCFFVVQAIGLWWMIQQMLQPSETIKNLYGFTFFLVIVHALHVVGGVAGLIFLMFGLHRNSYDHERYFPVRFCAIYWHFLDVVWVVMLACFALAAYMSKTGVH